MFYMWLSMSQFTFIFIILNVNEYVRSIIIPFEIIKQKCQGQQFKIGRPCEASILNGVPVINVKIEGRPIKFFLDSGSHTSYVMRNNVRCYTIIGNSDINGTEIDCSGVFFGERPTFIPSGPPLSLDLESDGNSLYSSLDHNGGYHAIFRDVQLFGCYHKETLEIDETDFGTNLTIGVVDKIHESIGFTPWREQPGLLGISAFQPYEDNFLWKYYNQLSYEQRNNAMIGFSVKCRPGQSITKGLFSIGQQITEFSTNILQTPKEPAATVRYLQKPTWAFSTEQIEFKIGSNSTSIISSRIDHVRLDTCYSGSFRISPFHYGIIKTKIEAHVNLLKKIQEIANSNIFVTMDRLNAAILNPHFIITINDILEKRQKKLIIPKEAILKQMDQMDSVQLSMNMGSSVENQLMFGLPFFNEFYTEVLLADFLNNTMMKFYNKDDCDKIV